MLTGIINRRIGVRAPVQSEVKINFVNVDGEAVVLAAATNLSAGGMQFTLPAQPILLNIGDKINFIFQLPDYGEIPVQSEIRYRTIHPGSSAFEAHYGVKFLDFSLDNWNSIRKYCDLNQTTPHQENNDESLRKGPGASPTVATLKTTITLENELSLDAVIEDLSFGGVRVNVERPLRINSCISLQIPLEDNILKLKGYCIWCAPEKITPQKFLAGIYFPHLDQEQFDQLKLLINQPN
jgi:hypothetical protein